MRRYVYWIIIAIAALLALNMGQIQADETKSYAVGTKLLFREYNVPLTIVPHDPRESGLPSSFDWGPLAQNPFGRNMTGPARDQMACGSCWAFASVACLEAWVNATYDLSWIDLSEEVLVSDCCDAGDCNGGYIGQAADWMVSIGTTTEACWPYTASNGPCSGWCPDPIMGRTNNWEYACGTYWIIDITKIKEALVNHGPLVTGMDVYEDFYGYSGGVYQHTWGSRRGGHAILITGYVDDSSNPAWGGGYFIAKNSWGPYWGPYEGYFAIAYQSNCNFGIESTYYDGLIVYYW